MQQNILLNYFLNLPAHFNISFIMAASSYSPRIHQNTKNLAIKTRPSKMAAPMRIIFGPTWHHQSSHLSVLFTSIS